ncbi:hypothetical protein J2Y69_000529 [Microbacterium resistens]|uniref:DUF4349 domain-containing protein n=1 Tax=Microbacterium resistens TaxID=156977 RepID=A0ABU1S8L4_9MICO|nr:DUF4349 domain-containing protein [Microbacterium resistens]MDR6865944.1 hypothetical protein [Microbacterium resistens]
MNTQNPDAPRNAAEPDHPELPDLPDLPEFSDEAVDRVEDAVFARIADERTASTVRTSARSRARRRRWLTAGGVAAAFAAGVLVTPAVLNGMGESGSFTSATVPQPADAVAEGGALSESVSGQAADSASGAKADTGTSSGVRSSTPREVVTTGNATVRVDDVRKAADALTALAETHGGYVESVTVGTTDPKTGALLPDTAPGSAPTPEDNGWISLRVPSADLTEVMAALGDYGKVESSSIGKSDVTAAAVDLRARIASSTASVERLTALMANAGSVSELLEAEVALTDRQAQLESYQQQLTDLESQISMSSLQVTLSRTAPAAADPAGFGDGLSAGWTGFIVSLNALVVAAGFVLPWLGIALLLGLVVWGIVRLVRIRRRPRRASSADES